MYADTVTVTKHAIEIYKSRVNNDLSDNQIIVELKKILNKSKPKKIRKCVFEENATEFNCVNNGVAIIVITKFTKNKMGKVLKKAIIVTCLGDKTLRNWHQCQLKKSRKKVR